MDNKACNFIKVHPEKIMELVRFTKKDWKEHGACICEDAWNIEKLYLSENFTGGYSEIEIPENICGKNKIVGIVHTHSHQECTSGHSLSDLWEALHGKAGDETLSCVVEAGELTQESRTIECLIIKPPRGHEGEQFLIDYEVAQEKENETHILDKILDTHSFPTEVKDALNKIRAESCDIINQEKIISQGKSLGFIKPCVSYSYLPYKGEFDG